MFRVSGRKFGLTCLGFRMFLKGMGLIVRLLIRMLILKGVLSSAVL